MIQSSLCGFYYFLLATTTAYPKHQNPLILREALLVDFSWVGSVVLGGLQGWWLQPILETMSPTAVFYGSLALTAITDNAALTYLGSLVQGTSPEFKLALVGGAVAGGGLTVIANAPQPCWTGYFAQLFPECSSFSGLTVCGRYSTDHCRYSGSSPALKILSRKI